MLHPVILFLSFSGCLCFKYNLGTRKYVTKERGSRQIPNLESILRIINDFNDAFSRNRDIFSAEALSQIQAAINDEESTTVKEIIACLNDKGAMLERELADLLQQRRLLVKRASGPPPRRI